MSLRALSLQAPGQAVEHTCDSPSPVTLCTAFPQMMGRDGGYAPTLAVHNTDAATRLQGPLQDGTTHACCRRSPATAVHSITIQNMNKAANPPQAKQAHHPLQSRPSKGAFCPFCCNTGTPQKAPPCAQVC